MNHFQMLKKRAEDANPIRVGLIGAGKFGSMFLSQAHRTPGIHLLGVADLSVDRARTAMRTTGWSDEQFAAPSLDHALQSGATHVGESAIGLIAADGLDVVIDASGDPAAGIAHVLACCKHKTHIIMVNVEADALAGPLLAQRAREAGIVYSMAYGDQPALIHEQVNWARTCGFDVVAAGKGTLYMPHYHASTPDTVWDHYGISAERAARSGMNPKMFNSFLDGTKSGIEMTAVANACGLAAPTHGLAFPAVAVSDLAQQLIPKADGGVLEAKGMAEVVSSRSRDGVDLSGDLRWGTYVTMEAPSDYVRDCFADYGLITDQSGRYTAMWRPYHLIGLELGLSVANVGCYGQATGTAEAFNADVVATAKRDMKAGDVLDGEGGFTVWGKIMPAAASLEIGALPIGLAHGMALKADIAAGETVCWSHVDMEVNDPAVAFRRDMEAAFS